MNSVVPHHPLAPPLQARIDALSSLNTEELRERLGKALEITATHLIEMAAIVRLLEERGEDMSDLRFGLLQYLRKIAFGQLLPEVVVKFQSSPLLMGRVAALPIPEQERVVNRGEITVVLIRDGGEIDRRLVPATSLSQSEIRQVFAPNHMRNEGEQVSWLRERRPKKEAGEQVKRPIKIQRTRGGVLVEKTTFISIEELRSLLKDLES